MLLLIAIVILLLPRCLRRRRALNLLAGGAEGVARWNRWRASALAMPWIGCANYAALALEGVDLSRMDLRASNFAATTLAGADLEGVDLRRCNLSSANLCGAILRRADLRFANLAGARLQGADLYGARAWLHGAKADRRTRWPEGFDPPANRMRTRARHTSPRTVSP